MADPAKRNVCPICGKPVEQRFRPFCSRRCADVDLNRWLSGIYAAPVVAEQEGDDLPKGSSPPGNDVAH